jgi:hypothetical protein
MLAATKQKPKATAAPAAPTTVSAPAPQLPDGKLLLSFADLTALGISWSREHIRRETLAGRFPAPLPLGDPSLVSGRKVWRAADIRQWLRERGLT